MIPTAEKDRFILSYWVAAIVSGHICVAAVIITLGGIQHIIPREAILI